MTRVHSRFIPGEEVGAVTGWDFASVDPPSERFAAKLKAQAMEKTGAQKTPVRQAGFSDGYAQGYAQGSAQATVQAQRQLNEYIAQQGLEAARNFEAIFSSARAQLAQQEQSISEGVLQLACALARQVLRHELSINPNVLLPVIREALGVLCADGQTIHVRMHPADADVFAQILQQEYPNASFQLLADVSVTRGGCVLECAGTVVDARLEQRWLRAVAALGLNFAWDAADESA